MVELNGYVFPSKVTTLQNYNDTCNKVKNDIGREFDRKLISSK